MVTFCRTVMVYQYNLTNIFGDHITSYIIFVMIEIDWDKTSLCDLKWRESIHDTLNGWGREQPLIQDVHTTWTILHWYSFHCPQLPYNSYLQFSDCMEDSTFSPIGCEGTHLTTNKWVDPVWLIQLRPTSSLVGSSSVSESSPLKVYTSKSDSIALIGVPSIMVILTRLRQLAA